ncbi:uncharacterized protein LOC127652736 [Xyrauchen texanus]|uniref:uncharacterized protein LOC127652736 n=1 Tax=Xyrauchen texanus TaxID=154827 RepID=UPI00224197A7|nr:uncharacterized protein LOC127652736 [Xyrauchen texanus]
MTNVMNAVDFQTQLTSIMEILAKTAIVEIGKLFEENSSYVRLEISRHISVNETLKRKCNLLESELQAARKTVEKMNGTAAPFSDGLTDTGHRPAIDNVFGKEWCMDMWRHEKSNVHQKENTRADSSVITGEPVNLIDDEPDMIIIKEETFEDHSGKNNKEEDQNNSLRGPAAASSDRCVAQTSLDFMTYTLPSEQLIDGETLLGLTEKMVGNIFPTMKQPNTFLKELEHDADTSSGLQIQLTQQRSSEPWPAVFSLPAFPQQLHEALQRKDPSLKKKGKSRLRSLLIQVLFDNLTKHTWYPNHTIYADVLGRLITKFPFLKDCSASGHDTLLQCLRNKFKKERISLVRSSTVQELCVKRNLMDRTSSDGLGFEEEVHYQTSDFPLPHSFSHN